MQRSSSQANPSQSYDDTNGVVLETLLHLSKNKLCENAKYINI